MNEESPTTSPSAAAEGPVETAAAETHPHPPEQHHHAHLDAMDARAVAVALMGWILPGFGHALLKMWGRAVTIFLSVFFLVYLGAGMRGNLFAPGGDDAFARLGYAADLGTGSLYYGARALETAGPDVSHAAGDYGTRFLATAGVLNLLAALHAYEAARRRKA
ncbi:MAG TPA: DUF6677 family protein [Candidatus Acidoferrum sp.]